MSKNTCTLTCPLIYAEKMGWVVDTKNYPSPFGDITLLNNSDGQGTWLQYKGGNKVPESEWCTCSETKDVLRTEKENKILLEQKMNRLKSMEAYPILHFLAQNYEPPITDEEMAQQL